MANQKSARNGTVQAVSSSPAHTFSKPNVKAIRLLAGRGVQGDAHCGELVKHRSRVKQNPHQPNLRQVHLIHGELHDELRAKGFHVHGGDMGENITTRGIELLALPTDTRLHIGETAIVQITGLRNPCAQLDGLQQGLMNAVLEHDAQGNLIRKGGVMGIVLADGDVKPGDTIRVELPPGPHRKLECV